MPFRPSSLWLPSCRSLLQECAPGCPHHSSDPTAGVLSLSFPVNTPPPSLSVSHPHRNTPSQSLRSLSLLLCLSLSLCLFPPFFALLTDQVPPPLQVACVRLCCSCRVTVSFCFPSVFTAFPHDTESTRRQELSKLRTLSMHVCLQMSLHCLPFYNLRHLASTLWSPVTITSE